MIDALICGKIFGKPVVIFRKRLAIRRRLSSLMSEIQQARSDKHPCVNGPPVLIDLTRWSCRARIRTSM